MIVKKDFDKQKIAESISALWEPLTIDQRNYLVDNIQINIFEKKRINIQAGGFTY